jgi:hypothetical protein
MANLSTLNGVNDIRIYKNFQEWTTPGTYTWVVPANVTRVRAIAIGGGGAGGASPDANYYGGDGGCGGGFAMGEYTVTPGQSITVTVGAFGRTPQQRGWPDGTGENGGSSSFGAFCTGTGGGGAGWRNNNGKTRTPGTASGGTLVNATGGTGGHGAVSSWGWSTEKYPGGGGGSAGSWLGTGGNGGNMNTANGAQTVNSPGGGGIGGAGGSAEHPNQNTSNYWMVGGGGGGSAEGGGYGYYAENYPTQSGFGGRGILAPRVSPTIQHHQGAIQGHNQGSYGPMEQWGREIHEGVAVNNYNIKGISASGGVMASTAFATPRLLTTVGSGGAGGGGFSWVAYYAGGNGAAGGGGGGSQSFNYGTGNSGNGGFMGGGAGATNENMYAGNGGIGGGGGGAGSMHSWQAWTTHYSGQGGTGYVTVEWA